jgi:hypothetical protein
MNCNSVKKNKNHEFMGFVDGGSQQASNNEVDA